MKKKIDSSLDKTDDETNDIYTKTMNCYFKTNDKHNLHPLSMQYLKEAP